MTIEGLNAWFLHKQPSGSSSLWISLFTREKGIVRAKWKGALTSQKKLVSLQPFTPLWLALHVRPNYSYINDLEAAAASYFLTGNSLMAGLYLNELIFYSLQPLDPNPHIFDLYQHTLQALVASTTPISLEKSLRHFEWSLLESCGYGFPYQVDRDGIPINPALCYQFLSGEGFVHSRQGIVGSDILALDDLNNPAALKLAKFLMRQAINQLLDGKELKSRQFALKIAELE